MIKLWVKRMRPNYYALCGFDAATRLCASDPERVREANLSFPSGHSSLASCGMTFLALHLLRDRNRRSRRWRRSRGGVGRRRRRTRAPPPAAVIETLVVVCGPIGWALFVAASRLVDRWHHPSDVLAGLGLGAVAASIAHGAWYPPPPPQRSRRRFRRRRVDAGDRFDDEERGGVGGGAPGPTTGAAAAPVAPTRRRR